MYSRDSVMYFYIALMAVGALAAYKYSGSDIPKGLMGGAAGLVASAVLFKMNQANIM